MPDIDDFFPIFSLLNYLILSFGGLALLIIQVLSNMRVGKVLMHLFQLQSLLHHQPFKVIFQLLDEEQSWRKSGTTSTTAKRGFMFRADCDSDHREGVRITGKLAV